jgi:hypothetical protein
MAYTSNNTNLELIKFRKDVAYSFLRQSRFDPYTSTSITAPIRRIADLSADGKQINIPLVDQLRSDGVSTGPLVGAEEGVDNYGYPDVGRLGAKCRRVQEVRQEGKRNQYPGDGKPVASELGSAYSPR